MTERPILFSAPMVRAILNGRKTQTRRVVSLPWKVEPEVGGSPFRIHRDRCGVDTCEFKHTDDPRDDEVLECGGHELSFDGRATRSPYGAPGDRLWVRETWASLAPTAHEETAKAHRDRVVTRPEDDEPIALWYRADGEMPLVERLFSRDDAGIRWRPSIHMPRWASRLTLEVMGVRVERLNDISEEDAKAEGADRDFTPCDPDDREDPREVGYPSASDTAHAEATKHRRFFRSLWESINGPDSWAANPWVWVVELKRVTP